MDGTTPPHPTTTSYLLRSLEREHGFEPLAIEGRIPDDLEGTLYRVGPGLFDSVGVPVSHLFEADGAVTAVRFGGGTAHAQTRIVESRGLAAERRAGVPLYGPRASYPRRLLASFRGEMKNTANTAPLLHQGRLFAMMEAALPTELDPETLATIGETDLGGALKRSFSAHPHRVTARRATYNFGVRYGRETKLDLYELPDEGPARTLASLRLERAVMLHDFIATDRHLVFLVSPFEVVLARAILQFGDFTQLFRFRPEHGTEVLVVPIDTPDAPIRFRVPAFYQWHFANAFEDGDSIAVDFVRFDDASSFLEIGFEKALGGELVRARISPRRHELTFERRLPGMTEFPSIDPRHAGSRHRIVFTTSESPTTRGIARHDLEDGTTRSYLEGPHTFHAEPVFVPRANGPEGSGYLVGTILDARRGRTCVAVFDAEHLEDGPLGRAWFDGARPITFHGAFLPAGR